MRQPRRRWEGDSSGGSRAKGGSNVRPMMDAYGAHTYYDLRRHDMQASFLPLGPGRRRAPRLRPTLFRQYQPDPRTRGPLTRVLGKPK